VDGCPFSQAGRGRIHFPITHSITCLSRWARDTEVAVRAYRQPVVFPALRKPFGPSNTILASNQFGMVLTLTGIWGLTWFIAFGPTFEARKGIPH
jgi:hypothetical protein